MKKKYVIAVFALIAFVVLIVLNNTRVEVRDNNGDGKKETIIYYKGFDYFKAEIDGNGDGKIDYTQYRKNKTTEREEIDKDFDGQIDIVAYYKNNIPIRIEPVNDLYSYISTPSAIFTTNDAFFSPYYEQNEDYHKWVKYYFAQGYITNTEQFDTESGEMWGKSTFDSYGNEVTSQYLINGVWQ